MSAANQPEHDFARVIAISSGKGGVGKSTLASNLGIALAAAGKKVCLFDADTNLANINILLGIIPTHTLEHFFNDDLTIDNILIKGPGGMDIVCGASGVADFIQFSHLQQKKLTQALRSLEESYHYLLIDTAAGIDETNISLILAAPYLLLVITAEPTSLTDAFSLLRVLIKHHFQQPVLIVVNMAASRRSAQATFKRFKTAVSKYLQLQQVHFIGYVLTDKNIPASILQQQAILQYAPESPASQCILQISERLLTVFGKKQQNNTPFSDYFNDLTLSDEFDKQLHDIEQSPSSEMTQAFSRPKELTQKEFAQTNFLQASHYARLLAEKKFNR